MEQELMTTKGYMYSRNSVKATEGSTFADMLAWVGPSCALDMLFWNTDCNGNKRLVYRHMSTKQNGKFCPLQKQTRPCLSTWQTNLAFFTVVEERKSYREQVIAYIW